MRSGTPLMSPPARWRSFHPGGFEQYFADLAEIFATPGVPDPQRLAAVAGRYGLDVDGLVFAGVDVPAWAGRAGRDAGVADGDEPAGALAACENLPGITALLIGGDEEGLGDGHLRSSDQARYRVARQAHCGPAQWHATQNPGAGAGRGRPGNAQAALPRRRIGRTRRWYTTGG